MSSKVSLKSSRAALSSSNLVAVSTSMSRTWSIRSVVSWDAWSRTVVMLAWTLSGELKTEAVTASVLPPVDPEDSVDPEDPEKALDPEEAVDAEDKGWEGVVKDGDSSDELDRISDD